MSTRKGPNVLQTYDDSLGRNWATELTEHRLLEIARIACPTDYAVLNYRRPNHPKFFGNRIELESRVRRGLARRTFRDREDRLSQMVPALAAEIGSNSSWHVRSGGAGPALGKSDGPPSGSS